MNITGKRVRVNWSNSMPMVYFDKGDILRGAREGESAFGSNGNGADKEGDYWAFREDGMLVCIGPEYNFEVLD